MSTAEHSPERRPIRSRDSQISRWVAKKLISAGISANSISLFGMFACVLAGGLLAWSSFTEHWRVAFIVAALLIQLRLLANMFDGMVAIESKQNSPVGELFNEVPDRISDSASIIGAGYAIGSSTELGYIAALLAVFIAYVRVQGKVAGGTQDFCGPMAKQHRMFLLTSACVVAALLPREYVVFGSTNAVAGLFVITLLLMIAGEMITVFRRLNRITMELRRPR